MNEIENLFNSNIKSIFLKILIFGPDPNGASGNTRLNDIRDKRIQIRDYLLSQGHDAKFPEDALNTPRTSININAALAEQLLMKEYDLIIIIVESYGSNVELGQVSVQPEYAIKSHLFISDEHTDGYAFDSCKLAECHGGVLDTFSYPLDITDCHLLSKVSDKVIKIQQAKFLLTG